MQIENYKPMSKGCIKGFFDLVIEEWGGFTIKGMSLFCKEGKRWIGFPQKIYEKDGEKKYLSHCYFKEREMREKFQEKVLPLIDEAIKELPVQEDPGMPF